MKKYTNLLSIIAFTISSCHLLKSMDCKDDYQNKKIKSSISQEIIKTPNGICYLQKLPKEMQNIIAQYLLFNQEESDHEFSQRIKSIKKNNKNILTPFGEVYIDHSEDLKIKNISAEYLIKNNQENTDDETETGIKTIATSKTKKQIVAIMRNISGNKLNPRFDTLNRLIFINKTTIWYIDPKDKTTQKIPENNFPSESQKINGNELDAIYALKNNGYNIMWHNHALDGTFSYILENLIVAIAISSDGKKIAFANNSKIFLSKKNENNQWESFTCIKSISLPPCTEITTRPNPGFYKNIDFNKQGTILGVKTKDDEIIFIPVAPDKSKTLTDYFRQKLVCKEFMPK